MRFSVRTKYLIQLLLLLLIAVPAAFASERTAVVTVSVNRVTGLGAIKGIVRDQSGSPIADAAVGIFRGGSTTLLKQVFSASDGSFFARILPGTYTVLAVAEGYNPVRLLGIEVGRAAEVNQAFNLQRAGTGNTLPEKRADRNSSKWRIRAAQMERSIYQHREGNLPVDPSADADVTAADLETAERTEKRKGQAVVESYFAGTEHSSYAGVNFATLLPVNGDAEIVFAGQTGVGKSAPQRFETGVTYRPAAQHELKFATSIAKLGNIGSSDRDHTLGQVSLQTTDEWKLKDGVILVLGFDYSRFFGAGSDASFTPRLGLQFDLDSKTRVRAAFTGQTEQKSWANAIELEGHTVSFSDPAAIEDVFVANGKPQMNKSRRLEFGVERILDGRSSVEANAFFDTTAGRGVGLNKFSFDTLGQDGFGHFVADQQGSAQGIRFVYNRRVNGVLSTAVGYSFGRGQRLAAAAPTNPADLFENDFFQSFFAQLAADLKTGTSVRTVFRLSPQATVFAIDPFKGQLAIYDPGLSVYLTQNLPTWGLPIRAQAIVDARNVLGLTSGTSAEDGILRLNAQGRMVRGGLQVRF